MAHKIAFLLYLLRFISLQFVIIFQNYSISNLFYTFKELHLYAFMNTPGQPLKQLLLFVLLYSFLPLHAQKQGQERIDSLTGIVPKAAEDTNKVKLLSEISSTYWSINPQEGVNYGKQSLELAQKLNWKKGMASAYGR